MRSGTNRTTRGSALSPAREGTPKESNMLDIIEAIITAWGSSWGENGN